MPIRITGMNSGLDTESIITELVKAKSEKKTSLVKAQTKLQWKQDAWKELNKKVYSFYSKSLSNMRLESDYLKKVTKVSNANAATVITGANAVNGVQTLRVERLAKSGYLTGAELKGSKKYKGSSKLVGDLGVEAGSKVDLKVNGKTTSIEIQEGTTINSFVNQLQKAGVNASFDETNQRFFISAKKTGAASDFSLTAKDDKGLQARSKLGLATALNSESTEYKEYMKYCNYDELSKTYSVKSVEDLKNIIQAEAEAKAKVAESKQKEKEKNEEEQQNIRDKYTDENGVYALASKDELTAQIEAKNQSLETKEQELATKEEELKKVEEELAEASDDEKAGLEERKKTLEEEKAALEEEKEALLKEKEELNGQLSDVEKLAELEGKNSEIADAISQAEAYFTKDSDGNVFATEAMETKVLADAAFAHNTLTNQVISEGATRNYGQDAKIWLNGASFESKTNTFSINGLTITANMETAEEFTITTEEDTDGIYDMIKKFIKEYNELINEMDSLYNAESSKGYEPLTDEEKEAMSESEIEKWEEKIKDSILRKDATVNSVASAMKSIMLQGVKMSNGTRLYLTDFGINTLGYFNAADNERNAYHIDGDPDDTSTSGNGDKLKTAIANKPQQVVEFFTQLSRGLYEKLGEMMKKTKYSSSFTLYDDVSMKEEYDDYKDKIAKQEEKVADFEDRYYKKFSAMETALAKMQSKESAISGLFGM